VRVLSGAVLVLVVVLESLGKSKRPSTTTSTNYEHEREHEIPWGRDSWGKALRGRSSAIRQPERMVGDA
jgi:hypothetical protein